MKTTAQDRILEFAKTVAEFEPRQAAHLCGGSTHVAGNTCLVLKKSGKLKLVKPSKIGRNACPPVYAKIL